MARSRAKWAGAFVSAIAVAGAAAGLAVADAGDLDPTFDGDGRQTTDFTVSGRDQATDVAIQADGKIVAVGRDAGGTIAVARYNTDGSLDSSFDGDGKLSVPFIDPSFQTPGVAIQPDGKIVIAGGQNGDFGVARYTATGTPDSGFDLDGMLTSDFAGGSDYAVAVAVQPDGKIVVAGNTQPSAGVSAFALARFLENGNPDGNFGSGGGQQTATFPLATSQTAFDMALQGNGRIVMAGRATIGSTDDRFALARFDSAGALDDTFDTDGRVATDLAGEGYARAVAITPGDSKIVAAGGAGTDFALVSYLAADGSPDTDFGGRDGIETTDFGGGDEARGIAIQADGKLVAAGETDSGPIDFAIARYQADGTLDGGFSGDGKQTTAFPGPVAASALDLALQADGKPVAVGATNQAGGLGDFALARYQAVTPLPPEPPPVCCAPPRKRLADLSNPVQGVLANVEPVAGVVLINEEALAAGAGRARASQKGLNFVPLTEARQIPVGSFLDVRRGTVRLQTARDRRGTRQNGDFSAGLFQVLQSRRRSARGLTDVVLKGSSFRRCRRGGRGKASASQSRLVRRLRANARGRFRTRGRHSAATVRGTVWLTADRCDGTLTRVTRGRVAVRDFRRRKTVLVRAGKSYLARAPR
jgi:uncharacterized delta-60 repeat protein